MMLPNTPEAKHMKHTNSKTQNPNAHGPNPHPGVFSGHPNRYHARPSQTRHVQQSDQTPVIFDLDSYSETELKELKAKFISDVERIRGFVKQIQARELNLKLVQGEKQRNSVTMHATPERENKNKRKRTELNSTESRKVEATMMRKCGVILDKLMKHRHGWVFNKPVDVVALRLPDYYQVVKRPMDLGTVKSKLGKRVYGTPLDFAKDVRLTFDNALLYNREGEDVYVMATLLLDMFDKLFDPAYDKYELELQRAIVEPATEEEALVSKKQRRVPEEEENPAMRREMSDSERDQLGHALQDMDGEYLDEILQIVDKRNSNMTTPDADGEIELDVHALDNETLWDLDRFVRLNSEAGQNNKVI